MHCFRLILLAVVLLGTSACKREDPYPELSDPIYRFLVDQSNSLKPALESEKKKLEESLKEYERLEVNSSQKKMAMKEILAAKGRIARLEQELAYSVIRRDRRRVESRRAYKLAFKSGAPWPDPKEFEAFMTHHRLQKAPRSWDQRVPKLNDRILAAWPKPTEKPKEKATGPKANEK